MRVCLKPMVCGHGEHLTGGQLCALFNRTLAAGHGSQRFTCSRGPRGYPLLTRRTTLAEATDDGEAIARAARRLLARAGLREPVRLLGVGVTNLSATQRAQLGLFEAPEPVARRGRLNRALDEIHERFGDGAIVRGGLEPAERAGLSLQIKRGERDDRPDD